MFEEPSKGDHFLVALRPFTIFVVERITELPDGSKRLWASGKPYPATDCEPFGPWRKLIRQIVRELSDLENCSEGLGVLTDLPPSYQKVIMQACDPDLRAKVDRLKLQALVDRMNRPVSKPPPPLPAPELSPLEAMALKISGCRFYQDVEELFKSIPPAEGVEIWRNLPKSVCGQALTLPHRPKRRLPA
jgi:hypothetical protein